MASPKRIAIIGAGFSGTLTAAHLLNQAKVPLTIHLVERAAAQFAQGVAYSTSASCHLLNVPAGNMSAYPADPDHFLRWAKDRQWSLIDPPWVTEVSAASFLPRRAYGAYLSRVLDDAAQQAAPGVRLERRLDEAVGVSMEGPGVIVHLADGGRLHAGRAVLALGNFRPGNPTVEDRGFYQTSRYHGDPWIATSLPAVLQTQSCLLIGSGLTMVDWALALNQAGYRGSIHVLSRRGLWPQAHAQYAKVGFALDPGAPRTIPAWLHQLRHYIRSSHCDWRAAVDALRPNTQTLWQSLGEIEQRRFLRHLRPYWDCHRHRIAPAVAARVQSMIDTRQLQRHVGRIQEFREGEGGVDVVIRQRGGAGMTRLRAEAVLNCSGSESDYRKLDHPLVRSLLQQGFATPDPLRLGLKVDGRGALLDNHGVASPVLYTLGPPQKGMLWETTAVPEIRVQAARLAVNLLTPTDA